MPGPAIQGMMHDVAIWTRASGQWTDSGTTWYCRIQPLAPTTVLHGEQFATSTHLAIGEATPEIQLGYKLVYGGLAYFCNGSQQMERPGVGRNHQEIYLTRSEAPA